MTRLYVFDIDRTIKPFFSDIPPKTKKALQLLNQHYPIALATGRSYNEAKAITDLLGIDYLICNGGYDVYIKHQLVHQEVVDFSDELKSLETKRPIHFFVCDNGIFSYHFPLFFKCLSIFKIFYSKISSIYGLINMLGIVQKATTLEKMGTVHKFYVLGKYKGTLPYVKFGPVQQYEIEQKELGIQWLMEYLGNIDEFIAFGDSRNDLSMFDMATRAYANKKGNKKLIAKATNVFDIKDGIYEIVLKELENV